MSIFSYSADIKHFLFTAITYINKIGKISGLIGGFFRFLQEKLQVDTRAVIIIDWFSFQELNFHKPT